MLEKFIDYGKCTSCMECERICTNSRVISKNDKGQPEFKYEHKCILCGHCLAICPQGAISFKPYAPESMPESSYYFAEPVVIDRSVEYSYQETMFDFLCSTRSSRYFTDEPIERDKISKIIDAMVRAPSAGNEQNRNYYILNDIAKIEKLEGILKEYFQKTFKALNNPVTGNLMSLLAAMNGRKGNIGNVSAAQLSFNQRFKLIKSIFEEGTATDDNVFSYLKKSHAIITITSDSKKGSMMHKPFYRGDACISATYGILMAKALGLASCWMGLLEIAGNKDNKIKEFLGINETERIDSAISLGYSDLKWNRIPSRGPVKVVWL